METSKRLVKEAGLHPKLKLFRKDVNSAGNEVTVATGAHTVKLVKDKEIRKPNEKNVMTDYVRYLVEENGTLKTYETRKFKKDTKELSYLILELSDYNEGDVVVLEGKKFGAKNYVSVKPATGSSKQTNDIEVEDEDEEE